MNPEEPQAPEETPVAPPAEPVAPPPTSVDPAAPQTAAQPNAADIAAAAAKAAAEAVAAHFGSARTEPTAPKRQRLADQIAQLPPEQRAELEARIAANPLQASIEIARAMAAESIADFQEQAGGVISTTGSLVVDSFMRRKADSDDWYKQIAPVFQQQLGNLNMAAVAQMSQADRDAMFDLRWQAAAGTVFRKAAASPAPRPDPPSMGGGSNGGSSARAAAKPPIYEADDGLRELTARWKAKGLMSDDDLKDIEATYQDSY